MFVVHGVPVHLRDSYQLWNEPKGPDFVLEVTSKRARVAELEARLRALEGIVASSPGPRPPEPAP